LSGVKVKVPLNVALEVTVNVNVPLVPANHGAGLEANAIVKSGPAAKLAVTDFGPFMVRFCGLVLAVRSPVKPEKMYPAAGIAVTCTDVPLLYQELLGLRLMVPDPDGLTVVVSWYWVVKLAV
jgi:hypothetical protein